MIAVYTVQLCTNVVSNCADPGQKILKMFPFCGILLALALTMVKSAASGFVKFLAVKTPAESSLYTRWATMVLV